MLQPKQHAAQQQEVPAFADQGNHRGDRTGIGRLSKSYDVPGITRHILALPALWLAAE